MDYDTINLIGLQPKDIQDINIIRDDKTVYVNVTLIKKSYVCPCCGSIKTIVKDYKNKTIIHSILNTNKCVINYRCRRYICKDCRKTFQEDNPFTVSFSKISNATAIQVLKDLKRPNYTFSSVAEKNNISVSTVVNIFDQYVDMMPGRIPRVLSIDEFYLGNGFKDKFACVFVNWETGKIIDIYPSRKKHKLHSYTQYMNKDEFDNVKYVSIDMNPTYRNFAHHFFKNCTVMVDSFHVVKNINEALNNLRISIMGKYDNKSTEYYLLKNWNKLLLMRKGNIEDNEPRYNKKLGYSLNKPQLLELILKIDPVLKAAYNWKEDYLDFNEDYTFETAGERYDQLYSRLVLLNIHQFQDVITFLKNWRTEIINSFILIDKRRISNGPIESINSRIKMILKTSLKYKNFERLRQRIMYCVNKDSLPTMSRPKISNKQPGKERGKYNKIDKKQL